MSDGYIFPVAGGGRITSGLGSRSSPGGVGSTNHAGIDIGGARGTGILAPIGGTVTRAGQNGGFGNFIEIRGSDGLLHRFGHLDSIGVRAGQTIGGGQQIGTLGSTGQSTGPHLHYETRSANGSRSNAAAGIVSRARTMANGAVGRAQKAIAGALGGFITGGPTGAITGGIQGGVMGGQSWLEQFQQWLRETSFFVRLSMVIIGLIFIAAAFAWIGRSQLTSTLSRTVKG